MWVFGKAAAVDFVVVSGAAGWWAVSVTVTVWEFASGPVVFAGGEVTADRSSAAGEETVGGVNFAAFVALEPCAFVEVLRRARWSGFHHLCNERKPPLPRPQGLGVPGGSVVLLETNRVERPRTGSSLPTPAPAESA